MLFSTSDTSPIELAPITVDTTRLISTSATATQVPPSTSVLPITTTTLESFAPSVDCVVENITSSTIWTSTVDSNSTQLESVISSLDILPITSCHNDTTTITTITSTVTLLPTSSEAVSFTTMFPTLPLPVAGEACEKDGVFMCNGEFSFAQCVFGQWISRNCTTGTICRESYDTNPPSIYCGFP
ncbi:unnamed protein product [Mucor circinelloides]